MEKPLDKKYYEYHVKRFEHSFLNASAGIWMISLLEKTLFFIFQREAGGAPNLEERFSSKVVA